MSCVFLSIFDVYSCQVIWLRPSCLCRSPIWRSPLLISFLMSAQSLNHLPEQPLVSTSSYSRLWCAKQRWHSITWVFVSEGWQGLGAGRNEKEWNEKQIRNNNLLFRFNYMFLFFLGACVICVQHWRGAQRQMACAVICQSFHSSLCRTNTHAHTNTCICAHMRSIWLSPLKAHLLKILLWDGTGAEIVAATFDWNAQKKKRGENDSAYKMMGNKCVYFQWTLLVLSTKTSVIWQATSRTLFLSSKELSLCPTTVNVYVSLSNHKHIHNYWRVEIIVILGKKWMN